MADKLTPEQLAAIQLARALLGYVLRPDDDEGYWDSLNYAFGTELRSPEVLILTALALADSSAKFIKANMQPGHPPGEYLLKIVADQPE